MADHIKIKTGKTEPIKIEKKYPVGADKIWKALTDPKEMKKWYFNIHSFKAEPGFEFTFKGGTENREYIHLCAITEAVEWQKLAYSWKYKGIKGESLVSFELLPEGNETVLKLHHTGLGSFPSNNPDLSWESFYEGWSFILGSSLKNYLQKRQTETE